MNYELAKKLKDAGFSQIESFRFSSWVFTGNNEEEKGVRVPTLSKLIEACGERFDRLMFFPEIPRELRWVSNGTKKNKYHRNKNIPEGWGSTPEEAVANLYLMLYSKDNATKINKNKEPDLPNNPLVSQKI